MTKQLQGVYVDIIMSQKRITSAIIESSCGLSASSVSRMRNGKMILSEEEFERILKAIGSTPDEYRIFCENLNRSPQVITPENKTEAALVLSTLQNFYTEQLSAIEARFLAEIERLIAAHERELQQLEHIHDREIERIVKLYQGLLPK